MFNPDSTKIRFEPSEDSDHIPESKEVKPIQGPKPTKDFKKVMSKTGRQGKEGEEELLRKVSSKEFEEEAGEQAGVMGIKTKKRKENKEPQGPVSLFDLSKRAAQKDQQDRQEAKKQGSIETEESIKEKPAEDEAMVESSPKEEPKKDRFTTRYTQEQPDISYVNPLAGSPQQPTVQPVADVKVEKPETVKTNLQEICTQIIKQMYTVEKKGQTDTVLILQYPPVFKDAKVVISSFDTAKGQFNISFENLTQAAQLILDKDTNRKTLMEALEKKGYNVQILTTTTTISENIPIASERPERDQQERGGGRERQRERQKDDREEG